MKVYISVTTNDNSITFISHMVQMKEKGGKEIWK